jgi:membrane-bound lytic murein transglycosylase D
MPVIPISEIEFEERIVYHDYSVRSGDNLWRIAQNNGCSVNDLMKWNNLRSDALRIGQNLRIRVYERVAIRKSPLRNIAALSALDRKGNGVVYNAQIDVNPETPNLVPVIDVPFPEHSVTLTRRMSVKSALMKLEVSGHDVTEADVAYAGTTAGYVVTLKK